MASNPLHPAILPIAGPKILPSQISNWPGIELTIDHVNNVIHTYAMSSRETEYPPIDSAHGIHNIGASINLWDGYWHNVIFSWSMDDINTLTGMGSAGTSALRNGILLIDGMIIPDEAFNSGKQTPLNFFHDWTKKLATFIAIGARNEGDSSTSYTSFDQVDQPYAGMLQRLVIWDRPLGPDGSTNFGIQIPQAPNGSSYFGYVGQWFGNLTTNDWEPLTGARMKALSSNVVAYYKFDEMNVASTSATDWAAVSGDKNNFSSGGRQTNPIAGNPINWHGVDIASGDYEFQDIRDVNEDGVMKTGIVAFQDSAGNKQHVGFINYDLGFIVLDGEFSESGGVSGVPFLRSIGISGMSTTQGLSASHFWVKKINFTSQEFLETVVINITSSGEEMNITENPTGLDQTTGNQLLVPNTTWPQSIGLYNDFNELVGIAKFNTPIRKDADHNVNAQVKLDFSGSYPTGTRITP